MFFKRNKVQLNDNEPAPSLGVEAISIVARDTHISGEFATEGDVRIDGSVHGAVTARRCEVGAEGAVEGPITAEEIVVRGRVRGRLKAYFVHLENGALVEGDIVNEKIMIDSGAELTGSVSRSNDPLSESDRAGRGPAPAAAESLALFRNSPWPETDDQSYRPLTAVRPR